MNAVVETGREFWGASDGKWAGEQMLKALEAGRPLAAKELRVASTLRKDEWKVFDEALVEEVHLRLRGVADLYGAGLTKSISGGLGKTVYEYEKMSDMTPAIVSMDGNVRSDNDRVDFSRAGIPLPITHKDFNLNLRTLQASRSGGEGLDTVQLRVCGRLIAEKLEDMLFNGSTKIYQGLPIYGYTTFPQRNKLAFGTGGAWSSGSKTGEQKLNDVLAMIAAANADRMYGPFVLYIPATDAVALNQDFKTASDKSVLSRLLEIPELSSIRTSDVLAADNLLLVQMTADNVQLLVGEPLQNIQWDINGGFTIAFKSFTIQVPLIRADAAGRSGIVHMNVTGTLLRDSGDEIRAAVSDRNLNEPTIEVDKAGVVRAIIANDDTLPEKPDQGLPGDGRERRPRVDNELPETPEPKKTGDAKK
jgi:uncharacterized linocin/CFP29 family protein